jgi:tetratricopeptide (TPR) repeat protein
MAQSGESRQKVELMMRSTNFLMNHSDDSENYEQLEFDMFGNDESVINKRNQALKAFSEYQKELISDRKSLTEAINRPLNVTIKPDLMGRLDIPEDFDNDDIVDARRKLDAHLDGLKRGFPTPESKAEINRRLEELTNPAEPSANPDPTIKSPEADPFENFVTNPVVNAPEEDPEGDYPNSLLDESPQVAPEVEEQEEFRTIDDQGQSLKRNKTTVRLDRLKKVLDEHGIDYDTVKNVPVIKNMLTALGKKGIGVEQLRNLIKNDKSYRNRFEKLKNSLTKNIVDDLSPKEEIPNTEPVAESLKRDKAPASKKMKAKDKKAHLAVKRFIEDGDFLNIENVDKSLVDEMVQSYDSDPTFSNFADQIRSMKSQVNNQSDGGSFRDLDPLDQAKKIKSLMESHSDEMGLTYDTAMKKYEKAIDSGKSNLIKRFIKDNYESVKKYIKDDRLSSTREWKTLKESNSKKWKTVNSQIEDAKTQVFDMSNVSPPKKERVVRDNSEKGRRLTNEQLTDYNNIFKNYQKAKKYKPALYNDLFEKINGVGALMSDWTNSVEGLRSHLESIDKAMTSYRSDLLSRVNGDDEYDKRVQTAWMHLDLGIDNLKATLANPNVNAGKVTQLVETIKKDLKNVSQLERQPSQTIDLTNQQPPQRRV